nr:4Fe-4S dicluster domain-containing protein [Anaerolineae bacterium]
MGFRVMPKSAFPGWVEQMLQTYRVVGPRKIRDRYMFDEVNSPGDLDLTYSTTVLPPKKVLLPQHEELLSFDLESGKMEAAIDTQPTVLLGVHTCDLHAIRLLDAVFEDGYADQHYIARRQNVLLVSLECLSPCTEKSFCKSMGTLSVTEGYDLHLTDLGDSYAIDIGSERGQALLELTENAQPATDADYSRLNQTLSDKWPRFPYRLESDITELANLLAVSYDSDLWEELGEKCLGCGSCTIVCPTCYCFNVIDEVDFSLNAGSRIRQWDGCTLSQFAVVAGGHNFRSTNQERQRHRFFRKGKYQMEAYGLVGCVGCGRCAEACLVDINPVDTFNELSRRRIPMTRRHKEVLP